VLLCIINIKFIKLQEMPKANKIAGSSTIDFYSVNTGC